MNERIQELALECYNPYSNFDHEKFAVLIIQECAGIAHGSDMPSKDIKEHFGIDNDWTRDRTATGRAGNL